MNGNNITKIRQYDENLLDAELIHQKEDKEGCYSKITISPKEKASDITYLIAKDKKSNDQFKCRVGFGSISKLIISKRFDKMNIGDIFEIDVHV